MSRLRIRIELNRGGVGVPLHKLASVVDESQKFFHLLAEDSQVDQSKGEWLGFDFGNESLNFTAEFVGPVTAEQVAKFHAAFDGTTSLRRTTIAQFARITESIEQDELIGFGLYLADDGDEPSEWRCLSRRDALRITEEIQLLIEASGEVDQESHLPAVSNTGVGARLFSDRRERGLETAKWTAYVRDVEANMDRRISRVEHALEGQSGMIEDLHVKSTSTEDSVRKLLTAVEGFCAQTTRQLEAISAPAAALSAAPEALHETARGAAASAVSNAMPAPHQTPPLAVPRPTVTPESIAAPIAAQAAASELTPAVATSSSAQASVSTTAAAPMAADSAPAVEAPPAKSAQPETLRTPLAETGQELESVTAKPWSAPAQTTRRAQPAWVPPPGSVHDRKRDWRLVAGFALVGAGVIILGAWAWQNLFSEPAVQRVAATSSLPAQSVAVPATTPTAPPTPLPLQTQTAPQPRAVSPVAHAVAAVEAHVTLEASELTWVSFRNLAGDQIRAHVFNAGETQSYDLPNGATLRVGNAGGIKVLLNGNSIGAVGPRGKVREVVFKDGAYKIVAMD